MLPIDRATEFRKHIREADMLMAAAIVGMLEPLRQRYNSNPKCPQNTLLRDARRRWISMPQFGSLGMSACDLRHKRLRLTERRVVSTTDQQQWWLQDGDVPAISVVELDLQVRPGVLIFDSRLLLLVPLPDVATWFAEHDDASDLDYLQHLASRLSAIEGG